jgi:hypothetical protein
LNVHDLNPIGILQHKAKDPSLTSGAALTLIEAAKHLQEGTYVRNPATSRNSVLASDRDLATIATDEAYYRPGPRRRARIVPLGRNGKERVH